MASSELGTIKITRLPTLSSQVSHILDADMYKFRVHAQTAGVRLKVITADATNWVTINASTYQDFENCKDMAGKTIFFIDDAATSVAEIVEFLDKV